MDIGKMSVKKTIKNVRVDFNGWSMSIDGVSDYDIRSASSDTHEFLYADYTNGWFRQKKDNDDGSKPTPVAIPLYMLEEAYDPSQHEAIDETPGTE